jgi:hypothetical protein
MASRQTAAGDTTERAPGEAALTAAADAAAADPERS